MKKRVVVTFLALSMGILMGSVENVKDKPQNFKEQLLKRAGKNQSDTTKLAGFLDAVEEDDAMDITGKLEQLDNLQLDGESSRSNSSQNSSSASSSDSSPRLPVSRKTPFLSLSGKLPEVVQHNPPHFQAKIERKLSQNSSPLGRSDGQGGPARSNASSQHKIPELPPAPSQQPESSKSSSSSSAASSHNNEIPKNPLAKTWLQNNSHLLMGASILSFFLVMYYVMHQQKEIPSGNTQ
jgi:hypothetical protein